MRVAVVGAGIGGLTAAATLANAGHAVTVLEATDQVGGKAGRRIVGGLPFDTGPSLLTMPHVLQRAMASAGLPEDVLDLRPVEPVTRYRFADGSQVDLSADRGRSVEALEAWSAGAGAAWSRYLDVCAGMWEGSEQILSGLPPWPPRRPTAADPTPDPRDGLRVRPHQTLRQFAHGLSPDPRVRQLVERFATYAGADPRRAPAVLALAGYVEHAFGVWYPGVAGGLHAIPDLLAARVRELGGAVHLGEPVQAIEAAGGRVRAIRTPGRRLAADAVLFAGDHRTLAGLIDGAPLAAPVVRARAARLAGRAGRRAPSVSGAALLLAVRPAQPTEVHHEIRFCADYEGEFDDLYRRHVLPADPTLYVSVPSVTERAAGIVDARDPERWFVLVNAPAGLPDAAVDARVQELEARLGLPDGAVVARDRRTPADLAAESGTPDGAIYGDAPHGRLGTLRRPGPLVPGLRGLLRIGGTVHPGGGVPLVMLSGLTAARLVQEAA
ncbi:MAG: FAD-dependent oxidoreductase [Patulibacter minatonensis]